MGILITTPGFTPLPRQRHKEVSIIQFCRHLPNREVAAAVLAGQAGRFVKLPKRDLAGGAKIQYRRSHTKCLKNTTNSWQGGAVSTFQAGDLCFPDTNALSQLILRKVLANPFRLDGLANLGRIDGFRDPAVKVIPPGRALFPIELVQDCLKRSSIHFAHCSSVLKYSSRIDGSGVYRRPIYTPEAQKTNPGCTEGRFTPRDDDRCRRCA